MEEKESHLTNRNILKEAYEQTSNTWSYVSVNDLYKTLICKLGEDKYERRDWIRRESKDVKRQLEIIHLVYLIDIVQEDNLKRFAIELQKEMPDANNSIQPLFNPNIEVENQPILSVQIDCGDSYILKENEFLLKSSTKI
ncbi:hypothetical protein A3K02_02830 [candidate division WS6 bacterium RIFOXYD1_FULL_33_8]|nr:MAG: hypothetical protein A2369_00135 [candidate division WS6 bacterium RIFOXYB1_FULL_33_15]OGC37710.1 MAG: hypothetical protein A2436_01975 [candidate division WS6 bacterium RIFOXYC1_FULL_33_9]OGC43043.1 MAG: hypothetical protein A3K02_02830 [candidate division WS6 bacterium RIFOXYD1_FULL_33_8]HBB64737.1 hypothetical protein [Patescibacteria group bacterium]